MCVCGHTMIILMLCVRGVRNMNVNINSGTTQMWQNITQDHSMPSNVIPKLTAPIPEPRTQARAMF